MIVCKTCFSISFTVVYIYIILYTSIVRQMESLHGNESVEYRNEDVDMVWYIWYTKSGARFARPLLACVWISFVYLYIYCMEGYCVHGIYISPTL